MVEVRIIGGMRHRNLVLLLGWCHHKSKGELSLAYVYMPKGSLDVTLPHEWSFYDCPSCHSGVGAKIEDSGWSRVVTALQFLYEGYEQCVVPRDIKASNVMLDDNFNARLGDFGLARLYDHNQGPQTTMMLAGSHGYMAPELFEDGKAAKKTDETDVYSFEALTLETATGYQVRERHPDGKTLVDCVWNHFSLGKIMDVADSSLGTSYDGKEMELVLHLGLLRLHPNLTNDPPCATF